MDLRKQPYWMKRVLSSYPLQEIEACYQILTSKLNQKYKLEAERTMYEKEMFFFIKCHTKLQVIRSCWIGKRNIDLFIPAYKVAGDQFTHKGLAIEIDGKIHETYFKMRQDESKLNTLQLLGIHYFIVENQDLRHPLVRKIVEELSLYRNQDFRSKRRMFRNIHISTLIAHKEFIQQQNITPCIRLLKALKEL